MIVIGGGLAGLAASTRLLEHGYPGDLVLLEKNPEVGGRTGFIEYRDRTLDLGQHMHVSGFDYYRKFMTKIGLADDLATQDSLDVEFRDKSGRIGRVRSNELPPPFHLISATYGFPFISFLDKLSLVGPLFSSLLASSGVEERNESFGDWLRKRGASEKSIARLWNQIIVPTLNASVDEVSVKMGLMILKRVLLDKRGGRLGRLNGSLGKIGRSAVEFIESKGGQVRTSHQVERIEKDNGKYVIGLSNGDEVSSEAVLSAVPGYVLNEILSGSLLDKFSQRFWELEWNSIINVHLFFEKKVMEADFFGFLEGTAGWVFNVSGNDGEVGKHICLTISDPGELEDLDPDKLVEKVVADLASPLPAIKDAELLDSVAIYQPRATFKASPDSKALRPPQNPSPDGLFLAGDWTDTGWPATMEGAVRSGYYSAEEILSGKTGATVGAEL